MLYFKSSLVCNKPLYVHFIVLLTLKGFLSTIDIIIHAINTIYQIMASKESDTENSTWRDKSNGVLQAQPPEGVTSGEKYIKRRHSYLNLNGTLSYSNHNLKNLAFIL